MSEYEFRWKNLRLDYLFKLLTTFADLFQISVFKDRLLLGAKSILKIQSKIFLDRETQVFPNLNLLTNRNRLLLHIIMMPRVEKVGIASKCREKQ